MLGLEVAERERFNSLISKVNARVKTPLKACILLTVGQAEGRPTRRYAQGLVARRAKIAP